MTDTTRPPSIEVERRRLLEDMRASVGDTAEFRIKTAEALADIRAELKYGALWMESHAASDKAQFDELRSKLGGVRSGIFDSEKKFSKLDGVKVGIGIAASFFLAVGAGIWAVFTFFASKP